MVVIIEVVKVVGVVVVILVSVVVVILDVVVVGVVVIIDVVVVLVKGAKMEVPEVVVVHYLEYSTVSFLSN